ncbi:MAG TPA: hypothetical protein PKD05_02945 [Candidatus Melainabacteria bacterium]|nr:hypothetical protein [Candidatus Melainabacteria bacterium]
MKRSATDLEFSRLRTQKGATLTEMLIASLLIGFSLAAIGEVMVLTTLSANKLSNRSSGISDARTACSRVQSDVRAASNFGDSYANPSPTTLIERSNYFPCTDNPLYKADSGPQHSSPSWTWSGWPTAWGGLPYTLNAQTLIIQQPKLLSVDSSSTLSSINGFPIKGTITSGRDNLDTIVYNLIPDPNQAGEFLLQRAVFVGEETVPGANYPSMINPPQTVANGIIGPLPNNGGSTPEIFSYWKKNPNPGASPLEKITDLSILDSDPQGAKSIIGVGMDLELRKPDSRTGNSNAAYQQRMGIHTEAFIRYNKDMSALN